jgi:uncharacterized protein YjbI with pentapeptide repeats
MNAESQVSRTARMHSDRRLQRITRKQVPEATDRDGLRQAAERSTASNRAYFVSFLVILAYLMIVIGGTTDYMLLVPGATVKLPFVETDVSLLIFYFSAPLIILTAHFNLLQNLESHNVKLLAWQACYPGNKVPRYLIDAFIYDLALLEHEGQLTRAVRIFSGMLFQSLAPATLLVLLWRFSDYQSWGISGWHFACLLIDLLMVGFFQRALIGRWRLPKLGWYMIVFGAAQFFLLVHVLYSKNLPLPYHSASDEVSTNTFLPLTAFKRAALTFLNGEFASLIMPRIDIDSYTSLTLDDKQPKLKMAFDGASDFASWFLQSGIGLDLRNRSLIGANLQNADLRKSILVNSDLQGANLVGARLAGANLDNTQLQGARLISAHIQGATMRYTHLQGASLYGADLQGADLTSAHLQGANLTAAKLQGANLVSAQLQGATFDTTDDSAGEDKLDAAIALAQMLQGDDDTGTPTRLQGAILLDAHLRGAKFNRKTTDQTIQVGRPETEKDADDWDRIAAMSQRGKYKETIEQARARAKANIAGLTPELIQTTDALSKALPELCTNSLLALTAGLKTGHPTVNEKPSANLINALQRLPQVSACRPHLKEVARWARSENIVAPELFAALEEKPEQKMATVAPTTDVRSLPKYNKGGNEKAQP